MANPIIKIKRSNAATGVLGTPNIPTLVAGEFGVDQINKNLYLGLEDSTGGVISVVVGGEGTFAKKTDVSTALTDSLKYKGEITITSGHLVDADFTGAPGTVYEPPLTGYYYSVGPVTGGGVFKYGTPQTNITLVEGDALVKTTAGWQRLVGGTALSEAISDLGDVFHYAGTVSAVDGTTPFDLTGLSDTDTGAYYKVGLTGIYTDGATTFNAKVGDAFVKTTGAWQKLDNVDVVVTDVSGETLVTGTEDTGYTVGLAPAFVTRMSNVEFKTQHITATAITGGDPNTAKTSIYGGFEAGFGSGGSLIKVPVSAGILEFNEFGNTTSKIHATLDFVDSSFGENVDPADPSKGKASIRASGHILGTGTGATKNQLINFDIGENCVIDGGSY